MKITMISNYINHHQMPFSEELYHRFGEDYKFIQTKPMEEERIQMGWKVEEDGIPYLLLLDREEELCRKLIEESDILLIGWNEREDLFVNRLGSGKLTFRISERIYREGQWKAVSPRGLIRKYKEHIRYRKQPVYLLCAGAYVASDFSLIRAYPKKRLRFGYFPEFIEYKEEELFRNHPWGEKKGDQELQLVFAGRFMPLKHPELAVRLAADLKKAGYRFHLHMIGSGEMEEKLKQLAAESGAAEQITFYGFLNPKEVRKIMEKSHIHLFPSNHLEGWGAVVNEAMNCGCVEVVNSKAGAARFLIRQEENGLMYFGGSYEEMKKRVIFLFEDPKKGEALGREAYRTIAEQWNAKEAVERLLDFYQGWKKGEIRLPKEGPFSEAPVISPCRRLP